MKDDVKGDNIIYLRPNDSLVGWNILCSGKLKAGETISSVSMKIYRYDEDSDRYDTTDLLNNFIEVGDISVNTAGNKIVFYISYPSAITDPYGWYMMPTILTLDNAKNSVVELDIKRIYVLDYL